MVLLVLSKGVNIISLKRKNSINICTNGNIYAALNAKDSSISNIILGDTKEDKIAY